MKKLLTILVLSAISYSFSSNAKDNYDPCYGLDPDCEVPIYCLWNAQKSAYEYNYAATKTANKVGVKNHHWGQPGHHPTPWIPQPWLPYPLWPSAPPWGIPWNGPWGGPWNDPWGGSPYNHIHGPGCGH